MDRVHHTDGLVKTIDLWPKEWSVSLEVKFSNTVNSWTNILHFTTGSNNFTYGSRIPAIFVKPNSRKLQICGAVNNEWNWNKVTDELDADKWIKIKISQYLEKGTDKYRFAVAVDSAVLVNTINEAPARFRNVKAYAPDPWNTAADVQIRNLDVGK